MTDEPMNTRRVPMPSSRPQSPTHLYAVGQAVCLKDGFRRTPLPGQVFRITRRLPPLGSTPQYRIRNDQEGYERVTSQDDLEPVKMSQSGATPVKRTLKNG